MSPYTTNRTLRQLARRVIDITFRHKLSHLGSCLTALPIIYDIYLTKRPDDRMILSAGHSGLSLLVVLEHFGLIPDAEARLTKDGIHPVRGPGIDCSTGSLGQGITVAVGMALARPKSHVYVVSTDGELAEGSVWESLYFAHHRRLDNLHVYINHNGWSATGKLYAVPFAVKTLGGIVVETRSYVPELSWFAGLQQHYAVMTADQRDELLKHYAD